MSALQVSAGGATALGNLGLAHAAMGALREAAEYLAEAAAVAHRTGRSMGLATTLCTPGGVLSRVGELSKALEHLWEAFDLYRSAGSLSGGRWCVTAWHTRSAPCADMRKR